MRAADIGDQRQIGSYHPGKFADLSCSIHAHLEDREPVFRRHRKGGQGETDI